MRVKILTPYEQTRSTLLESRTRSGHILTSKNNYLRMHSLRDIQNDACMSIRIFTINRVANMPTITIEGSSCHVSSVDKGVEDTYQDCKLD